MKLLAGILGITLAVAAWGADPVPPVVTPIKPPAAGDGPLPNPPYAALDFDYYVFSMSYNKDFCSTHKDSKSCATVDTDPLLVLHGLWPTRKNDAKNQYSFCGYSVNPLQNLDWCDASIDVANRMSSDENSLLAEVMPSGSCLYNHEWYKHGTCSGLDPDQYFLNEILMATSFQNLTTINGLIMDQAGNSVSKGDLQSALSTDLGSDAVGSVIINCRKDNSGDSYLSEIQLALDKDNFVDFPSSDSFTTPRPYVAKDGTSHPDTGSCPEQNIHITP